MDQIGAGLERADLRIDFSGFCGISSAVDRISFRPRSSTRVLFPIVPEKGKEKFRLDRPTSGCCLARGVPAGKGSIFILVRRTGQQGNMDTCKLDWLAEKKKGEKHTLVFSSK